MKELLSCLFNPIIIGRTLIIFTHGLVFRFLKDGMKNHMYLICKGF